VTCFTASSLNSSVYLLFAIWINNSLYVIDRSLSTKITESGVSSVWGSFQFEVMVQHALYGERILQNSKRELFQLSSVIAISHHEKYNGSGYPYGLSGLDIPIEGRIVAIADVFDALGCERSYKKAWSLENILDYFKEQKGIHFDPHLVELFFKNIDEFIKIRESYVD
jgi:response regulator RpfG family c-di-GMP phosphodiesterase